MPPYVHTPLPMHPLERHLAQLLDETPAAARARVEGSIAAALTRPLVLFGAGGLGRRLLGLLRQAGIAPLAFADNDPARWGHSLDGLEMLAPDEAARRYASEAAAVITMCNPDACYAAIARPLAAAGWQRVESCIPLLWRFAAELLPYYAVDLPQRLLEQEIVIRQAYNLWADLSSQRTYVEQVRWRLCGDGGVEPSPCDVPQYFPPGLFCLHQHEVFVDGGAYDGDTLRDFLPRCGAAFARFLAIEPDPANFVRLQATIEQLGQLAECDPRPRIRALQAALGRERGRVAFAANGSASAAVAEGEGPTVECYPLDELLLDIRPTYIKLDVEGAERDALVGCRRTIARARPILAVCVYHRPDDLWHIPLLLARSCRHYRFFLRRHRQEAFDVVCYAIPEERCIVL